jgi:hypothetical protein
VQFIHGSGLQRDQLGIPGVYAYSVDDAVGNLNVEATGYVVDIGSDKNLEGNPPLPAQPPIGISYGYESLATKVHFTTYGVCGNKPTQQHKANPSNAIFYISPTAPENCPIYFTDSTNQTYTLKITKPPAGFTVIPTSGIPDDAVWSQGNNMPTNYNTVNIINCGNNTDEVSKTWCCQTLPPSPGNKGTGNGVYAYSTPDVPPTAHQLLLNKVIAHAPQDPKDIKDACNFWEIAPSGLWS